MTPFFLHKRAQVHHSVSCGYLSVRYKSCPAYSCPTIPWCIPHHLAHLLHLFSSCARDTDFVHSTFSYTTAFPFSLFFNKLLKYNFSFVVFLQDCAICWSLYVWWGCPPRRSLHPGRFSTKGFRGVLKHIPPASADTLCSHLKFSGHRLLGMPKLRTSACPRPCKQGLTQDCIDRCSTLHTKGTACEILVCNLGCMVLQHCTSSVKNCCR